MASSSPTPNPTPTAIFWELIDPLLFLWQSATYIPLTILSLILRLSVRTLLSPVPFKDAWFARFWAKVGPETRANALPRAGPLVASALGVVLDVGPGSGEWVSMFERGKVSRVYGVEPNRELHARLRERVREAGLEEVYVIVGVGIEELGEKWVGLGEVDTIVTIQCLCSVPDPRKMIGKLYGYLKEGGRWVVYEHVVAFEHQGWFVKKWQATIDLLWPHFIGGCSITRDTPTWLKKAGPWTKVDLKQPEDEAFCHVIPHIMGSLTK